MDIVVYAVENRTQNAILAAIDSIIVPLESNKQLDQ